MSFPQTLIWVCAGRCNQLQKLTLIDLVFQKMRVGRRWKSVPLADYRCSICGQPHYIRLGYVKEGKSRIRQYIEPYK